MLSRYVRFFRDDHNSAWLDLNYADGLTFIDQAAVGNDVEVQLAEPRAAGGDEGGGSAAELADADGEFGLGELGSA